MMFILTLLVGSRKDDNMDITFHYFAVKTLARKAGFDEDEAQDIAAYSQFVDDFNWIKYIRCSNIPDYIKDDNYDLYISNKLYPPNFNPAMTGFSDYFDMAFLALTRTQKFTVSPFHFIPPSLDQIDADTRTVPAVVGDGSLISTVVEDARDKLLAQGEDRYISLMRLGMALHTFADTYAHQLFSGYNSWVNDVKVTYVTDNITHEDLTEQVQNEIDQAVQAVQAANQSLNNDAKNMTLLSIGHMWAGHTPDLTNVSFEMKYKSSKDSDGYDRTYARSNTETFVTACRHIINLLLSCRRQGNISDSEWAVFSERLADAFRFKFPEKNTEATLAAHWHNIFPEYSYNYSKAVVENSFIAANNSMDEDAFGKAYSDIFYRYNCIADDLLVRMYGPAPRRSWWN